MVWCGLVLFIACWMFVLGILVGRGTAPVDLDAGKLEQELRALKATMAKKEQGELDAPNAANGNGQPELGFYEALKENKGQQQYKIPTPAPPPKPKPPAPKPAAKPPTAPMPAPKEKSVPTQPPSTKPETAAAVKPKPAAEQHRFTIQVAAVKEADNAKRLVNDLREKGYPAYQISVTLPGKGAWYRVRVGAYENRALAERMLKKLNANQINAMIVGTN